MTALSQEAVGVLKTTHKDKDFQCQERECILEENTGAFCTGRAENVRQSAEPASAAAHTRRLPGKATSSDGEKEALESPVLGTHAERVTAAITCFFVLQQSSMCSSVLWELKERIRRQTPTISLLQGWILNSFWGQERFRPSGPVAILDCHGNLPLSFPEQNRCCHNQALTHRSCFDPTTM